MLKAFQNRMKDDKGFTLIELMVVVLIIAILIAIAIPTFLGLRQRAQDRAAQSDLRNGLTAAKAFYTDEEMFTGFDTDVDGNGQWEAQDIEPSLTWNNAAAVVTGEVSIRITADNEIVLARESQSGTVFCIGDNAGLNVTGEGDVADVAACAASGAPW